MEVFKSEDDREDRLSVEGGDYLLLTEAEAFHLLLTEAEDQYEITRHQPDNKAWSDTLLSLQEADKKNPIYVCIALSGGVVQDVYVGFSEEWADNKITELDLEYGIERDGKGRYENDENDVVCHRVSLDALPS